MRSLSSCLDKASQHSSEREEGGEADGGGLRDKSVGLMELGWLAHMNSLCIANAQCGFTMHMLMQCSAN